MSLERIGEAAEERDALEFLNVGLGRAEAVLLLRRVLRDTPELAIALNSRAPLETVASLLAEAWLLGATASRYALQGHDTCHVCGCTPIHPCERNGHECVRVGPFLCSECEA